MLIDADADMDLEDYEGRSAIDLARAAKHLAAVDLLSKSGALE
jgi:ankyrin repeat protein